MVFQDTVLYLTILCGIPYRVCSLQIESAILARTNKIYAILHIYGVFVLLKPQNSQLLIC